MTENVPAVREPSRADVDSWIPVLTDVTTLARGIADTEFVPKGLRGSVAAVSAAILYGREVGLPPMTALTQTYVLDGKPAIYAEAMRALILAAGHDLEVVETTGATCTMRGKRAGGERWTNVTWTIDMARAAGLLSKSTYQKFPRQLLQARSTVELARLVFPDVIHGFRAVEELEEHDGPAEPAPTKTTVKRATSGRTRKAVAATPAATETPGPTSVIPLPGEPGYDTMTAPGDAPESSPTAPGVESPGTESPGGNEGAPTEPPGDSPEPDPAPAHGKITGAQSKMLNARVRELIGKAAGLRDERLAVVGRIVGHEIESTNDLTKGEASTVLDTLARVENREQLYALLNAAPGDGS